MKHVVALTTAALTLALAPPASAGQYQVKSCFTNAADGPTVNGAWAADMAPDPFVTAYTACPGEGIATSMTTGPGNAWEGASARHTFTAPAGTRIVAVNANLKFTSRDGWYAGFVDSSPSWIWCGQNCTSFGQFWGTSFATNTQQLFAQVTCGRPSGCPRAFQNGHIVMKDITVTVQDDSAPSLAITGGSVTQPGWHSGNQTVEFAASDPSGIRFTEVFVNGVRQAERLGRCSPQLARPCTDESALVTLAAEAFRSDNSHVVSLRTEDAAGNERWVSQRVLMDRTPPARPQDAQLEGDSDWRTRNDFAVSWRNPTESASPIDGAHYSICPSSNWLVGQACIRGVRRGRDLTQMAGLAVPGPGEWRLNLWLQDAAGNADQERAISIDGLRFDAEVPAVAIAPLAQDDPTRIRVIARDDVSGIEAGQVEVRRAGETAWRSVQTGAVDEVGFAATLDDEIMPNGVYEVRARAVDRAGNERTTLLQSDGEPASRKLPLRIKTRLVVGKRTRVQARGADGKRRYRIVLRVRPRSRFGRTIPLTGQLSMPGGNPLAGADLEVWERRLRPSAEWRRVSVVRTSRTGRFRFMALQGPSRTLRFRYPGTATIRARSTNVQLRVRALTSFRVTSRNVVNGEEVRFRGRLRGQQFGTTGKLIHLQVYTRGRWSTFATPRANQVSGRWSEAYRFTATRGLVRYRFRALVPREASFPYETGASRSLRVTVRGL